MNFAPKTEEEIKKDALLPAGDYDFEVIEAADKISKTSGNPMIALKLNVYSGDGGTRHVYDYLMEQMAYKLRHFCQFTGLIEKYQAGTLTAQDCLGRVGRVSLRQKIQDGYDPKNEVKDYVNANAATVETPAQKAPAATPTASASSPQSLENQDDIPF